MAAARQGRGFGVVFFLLSLSPVQRGPHPLCRAQMCCAGGVAACSACCFLSSAPGSLPLNEAGLKAQGRTSSGLRAHSPKPCLHPSSSLQEDAPGLGERTVCALQSLQCCPTAVALTCGIFTVCPSPHVHSLLFQRNSALPLPLWFFSPRECLSKC